MKTKFIIISFVVGGLVGTTYRVDGLTRGDQAHFVVRAIEPHGADDGNTIIRSGSPTGPDAVYLLEEFLTTVDDPPAEASFEYGRRKPHCWIGYSPEREGEDLSNVEFLSLVADHLRATQPPGTVHTAWSR